MMVLAYAIVCPWEAVAIGNLLARIVPAMNDIPLYTVAGKVITLPRLIAGLALTAGIGFLNYRGIRLSGRFQDIMTLGLLACFALFVVLGFARGSAANVQPLFAPSGAFISVLLVAQIVPYFMTGFDAIPKASEEARADLPTSALSRTIILAIVAGGLFYVLVVGVVAWVYPWTDLVTQHLGTEAAFARAFGCNGSPG
jgi:amino acid transporter